MASTTYRQYMHQMSCKHPYHRAITAMVRNAGQLPQPFWLGAAHGGGSCSAAHRAAR